MNQIVAALLSVVLPGLMGSAPPDFQGSFTGATLRIDVFHSGNGKEEVFALDRLIVEREWCGSRTRLLDDTGLGLYLLEISDRESAAPLYSRGFCSIFGEWATTAEANGSIWRTFPEALTIPEPRRPFTLRISKRDAQQHFAPIYETSLDPQDRSVVRAPPPNQDVLVLIDNGPCATKVDLLILGDGYTQKERASFRRDAEAMARALFAVEPYKSRIKDFNVRAIAPPAPRSGISRPRANEYARSPLGVTFNAFDSDRYALTFDDRRWRDVAAAAPHDAVMILFNERKYGGGGIFNLYATAAARSSYASYLFVHEFGHAFAGLADEYFTSPVAYQDLAPPTVEPWEPNVTALLDPATLKWKDLLQNGAALPTPWPQEEFLKVSLSFQERRAKLIDALAPDAELEALFDEERERMTALLAPPAPGSAPVVGAFEGAAYQAKGLYRPQSDCIMFTRDEVGFCAPCRRAIERVIDLYAGP